MLRVSGRTAMSTGWQSLKYLAGRYVARRRFMIGHAGGASFRFKTEDAVGRQIYKRASYEPELTRLIEREVWLRSGEVALDVGANIGWYSVLLSRLAAPDARVFAFEPDPLNLDLLRRNLADNRCAQVTAVGKALAGDAGVCSLYRYPNKNLGRHSVLPINSAAPIRVEAISGDAFLREQGVSPSQVRFIKVDVEGFEFEVLRGLQDCLATCPLLACEFSPAYMRRGGQDVHGFLAFLSGRGYEPHRLEEHTAFQPVQIADLETLETAVDLVWRRGRS
jgi:FkbM family methyltransferase